MRIESVDLNLLDKDKLISFYIMEYDLSMSMVDKLINIDKINYIKKNMMRYHLDKNYKTEIDKYNTGGLELNVCLGKYYDEFKKNQKHNDLRIQKSNVLKRKLEDLNNDIITKNNNCFLKFCYKDDKLVGFIEYEKRDDELYISRLYSSIKRCGIGSSLINSLDGNLSLDVMINNPARVLYERLGFEYILNEDGNKIIVDNNYKMKRGKTNVKKK